MADRRPDAQSELFQSELYQSELYDGEQEELAPERARVNWNEP